MATHKSSEKRARQSVRRNKINRSRKSALSTVIKSIEVAIESGDAKAALAALRKAEASLASKAGKGLMPKKTAARKTSRLAQRVRKAATTKAEPKATATKAAAKK